LCALTGQTTCRGRASGTKPSAQASEAGKPVTRERSRLSLELAHRRGRLLSQHGYRWGALRHRWRAGDPGSPSPAPPTRCGCWPQQIAAAYLTNTTTRTRGQIAAALTTAGMTVRPDEVITAAALTADYVRTTYPDARCFLVNNGDITDDMPGIDIVDSLAFTDGRVPETPDVVLLGGAGPEYSHLAEPGLRVDGPRGAGGGDAPQHRLDHHRGTAHRHRHVPDRHGGDLGAQRHRRGQAGTGQFLTAAARLGVEPEDVYMVGDDLNNDVLAAQVVGMTGVLVRTGKFRQDTLDRWAADEFAMQPNRAGLRCRPAGVAGCVAMVCGAPQPGRRQDVRPAPPRCVR
jgi:hypothetical protein